MDYYQCRFCFQWNSMWPLDFTPRDMKSVSISCSRLLMELFKLHKHNSKQTLQHFNNFNNILSENVPWINRYGAATASTYISHMTHRHTCRQTDRRTYSVLQCIMWPDRESHNTTHKIKVKVETYSSLQAGLPTLLRELTLWDHTVLPATRQRWHSRLYPSHSWYSI